MAKRFLARHRTARQRLAARRLAERQQSRRLTFQALDDRRLLAAFADSGTSLNLTLGTGENVAILSTGSTYQLSLGTTGTWSGTNDSAVTGAGSSTLTVTSAGISQFTVGIDVADTGSGGDGVAFSNSGASGYANNFVVNLTQASSSLTFVGTSSFTGSSSLSAAVTGNVIIDSGASASLAGGLFSLKSTGANSALTVDGNVVTGGGAITLQATGAVTVGTGVVVNSGSGTLTLAADVTNSGTGDDGVGTLSIDAGATVTSSNTSANAITLRGADVNIDTSSDPAVIGGNRVLSTTPSANITGIAFPTSLAVDSSGNLYVANGYNNTVDKFAPGSTVPSVIYSSGVGAPDALAFDSSGNLYVANTAYDTVSMFAPGITTASATYSTGSSPDALVLDSGGNLYVANSSGNTVIEFARGSTTVSATYSAGLDHPDALAIDSGGNLYVSNANNSTVIEFAAGSTTVRATYSAGLDSPEDLAFDSSGNLYVSNYSSTSVSMFAPGSTTVSASYTVGASQRGLIFDSSGNLYVTNAGANTVTKFAPGSTTAAATLVGLKGPGALAVDASGNIYVTNQSGDTVSRFAPNGTTAAATYSAGLSEPNAIIFDSSGNLYAANAGTTTVSEFAPGATTVSTTYPAGLSSASGLSTSEALAFDSNGNLYVANGGSNTVSEFAPGSTTVIATYSAGLSSPDALAFDASGNLYVANSGNSTVIKFGPGKTTASATYSAGLDYPAALAIDSSGNLYVANAFSTTVSEFARGTTTLSAALTGLDVPDVLALDSKGDLYVGNYGSDTVSKFAPGSTTATATLVGVGQPEALAFDSGGDLFVANYLNATVCEFLPGATSASATFSIGVGGPDALAFDSRGNLYVANYLNSSVSEFALGTSSTPAAGGVVIQSSVESRPMSIGGLNNAAVAGVNLTSAELAQIFTLSTGTVTIGDANQTGNITFSTATPETTSGAALNVVQSITGAGQIILDDGAGTATALNGNGGNIAITAGTGGIDALAANNNTAEIATTGTSVTLLTTGPIGTSTNRIQFADDSNTSQQNVSIGSTTIQPGSVYLDGLGSLTLGGILGSTSNATIDVTARSNLVVVAGAIITSGTSTLSLGADLTAAEMGDNGVGTLTVNAGAMVTSSNTSASAITLRGADINIDTSSNPAVVGATHSSGTTASTTYSAGLNHPAALAFDSSGNLYVANYAGNTVEKFAPGSTTPSATYSTGVSGPNALAFDSSGNLYVADGDSGGVSKYAPGSTTPSATYSAGVSSPAALAFDSSGNLYVASNNTVIEFPAGSTTPSAGYSGLDDPQALAFDSSGNLYVVSTLGDGVVKFAPGSTTASAIYTTGINDPIDLALDSSGNLYVVNDDQYAEGGNSGNTVTEFAPGSSTPSVTYSAGLNDPRALAIDSSGDLYVANYSGDTVVKFAPGSTTASLTYATETGPLDLAFDSSGNLYVADYGNNAVQEFAPAATMPTARGVVIQSSVESRPMSIGGLNNAAVAGINLTTAELAQIETLATGTVTIGNANQTGNITFSTATPETTAGAALNVVQSITGTGQIILDDGAGTATALNGNSGNITITAGTGGVVALAANNNSAEIVTTGASVTLLTTGPIGTSTNRIQFADDSNTAQQNVSIGSTTIQPTSVYLDGLGSLTLGSILGSTSDATIDVTARTNLVVAAGTTITSGTSTLSLGADLTAAETGDNGVGTLTVNAGATVTSSNTSANAITLRGADVNIDTSSNPAVVGANRVLNTTPIATYSAGLYLPEALAFDSSGNLYVASDANSTVTKFAPGSTTASATYSAGVSAPYALAFDTSGNLYVVNYNPSTVSKFAPGSTTASATYSAGLSEPIALAFDSSGDLYVADYGNGTVIEFAAGSTTTIATYSAGLYHPIALAFDSGGNLYVADQYGNTVSKFASGSTTASASYNVPFADAVAFDSSGDLYVASGTRNTVSEFAPGSTTAGVTYSAGVYDPVALVFDSSGNLYVADSGATMVPKFAPGSTTPSVTYSVGIDDPTALALDSSGNLYVANAVNSTVSKFAPAGLTPAAGGAVIQSSVESRPMSIGGTNNAAVAGINLTSAELAQIFTLSTGTVTIGDANQTGNITFSTATPETIAGAALNVVQSITGAGQVILDDGAGTATALNGNGGKITITAGTGGVVALAANNNSAEIVTTGASVTLLTTGPIGTSTNRIQFADDSNTAQQNVSIGSTTIQPGSIYLDGLGSLTLGNILAGASNAPIDVTARTNLVVAAGAMINSGTSTLSLGADLTAAETGDNGVGTLSINAGATVTSSNSSTSAITLRGADINISTGINAAVVGTNRQPATTPSATYSAGVSAPDALAIDPSGNLYVANYGNNTVSEFAPGSTTASATYEVPFPGALAIDSSGNLYVGSVNGTNTVTKFAPGSTTASVTFTDQGGPYALAIDALGDLFVANEGYDTVSEFAPGSTTVSATLSGVSQPFALAFDPSGNLYVANYGNSTISGFAPGSTTASVTYSAGLTQPRALAFDSAGNLYVANRGNSTVSQFAPGSTMPDFIYTADLNLPNAVTINAAGDIFVASAGANLVVEFATGDSTPVALYNGVSGMAFDSSGDLYVANGVTNTVNQFVSPPTAGGVVIQSSVESRPLQIGGLNTSLVNGINLTSAELAQIETIASGTITLGDANQTGNITFSTATPATTPGAALNVLQSTAGAGQIILDDGAGSGTGLNGNGGTVSLTPGTGGIQTAIYATGTPLASRGFTASGKAFNFTLGFAPTIGAQLTIVNNTAAPATGNPISGTFSNLSQGGTYTASYLGTSYYYQANYQGGDGNDLVLTDVAGPATQLIVTGQPPASVAAGGVFALTVTAEDAQGNVATSFAGSVTVALVSNPGGSILDGLLTTTATAGVAVFAGLLLAKAGAGYTLLVSSSGLTSATTAGFNVTGSVATVLAQANGAEFRVNTYTTGNQQRPKVATDAAGNYVIVWQSFGEDGSQYGVYAQRYNAAGVAQGSEFLVNTYTSVQQMNPSVAMDAAGDFIVTWQSITEDGDGFGIYAQRYNSGGVLQGSEFQVNTYTTGDQTYPTVAMDSAGDFVIAWNSSGEDGSSWGIYAQRFNAAGIAQGGEFRANTYTTGSQYGAAVASDPAGDFVIAWESYSQDGSGYGVYAQRYNAAGLALGSEFQVSTYTPSQQEDPSVAMDSAGDFVVAWDSGYGQDGSLFGVYAQRYNAGGTAEGSEFRVNTYTTDSQTLPAASMDSSGSFVIVWQSYGEDGSSYKIYAQRYSAIGVAQGSEFRVNSDTTNSQDSPAVAMDAAGDFVIAWQSYGQDGSKYGVYAQRYLVSQPGATAGAVGSGFQVNTYTTGNQEQAEIADDAAGDYVTVWSSYGQDGSGYGVYAQRYNAAGAAQGSEFRVNTSTLGNQEDPDVALDATGDFVIAWDSMGQDGSQYGVYAQRYNAGGVPQGSEFQVNTYTFGTQYVPKVAMDSVGDFVIAWTSNEDGPGGGYGIYAQRYNALGAAQGSEFRVNTYTTGQQLQASVAMDSVGDFTVAWASNEDNGSGSAGGFGIYAQRYNALGGTLGSEFLVNTYTTGEQLEPAVGMDSAGDFVVSWASYGYGYPRIYAQRYSAAGAPQGSEFQVNTFTTFQALRDATAMDSAGDFVITWAIDAEDGGGWGVYAQRYNAAGTVQGSEFRINTYTTNSQNFPSVAMDSDGDFVVAWQSYSQDGSGYGIYAQAYDFSSPPVVTTRSGALAYTAYSGPQAIDAALALADGESTVLTAATVAISSGFAPGEDVLGFTAQNGITGSYNSTTGVLLLTGTATVANYQAALESVTYADVNDDASTAARTINFTVSDGVNSSNTAGDVVNPQTDIATQLVITAEPPASVTAGVGFAVSVAIEDAQNNLVTAFAGNVTLALAANPGSGLLGGTLTVAGAGGVATFSALNLTTAASGYTLEASSPGLAPANSTGITVTPGALANLLVSAPTFSTAGSAATVMFTAEDAYGNVVTNYNGPVSVADNAGDAIFSAPAYSSGVGTFSETLDAAGVQTVTIRDQSTSVSGIISVTVRAAAASQLVIVSEPPSSVTAGSALGLSVAAEDLYGNIAFSYSGTVTIALANNPGGSTLAGTLSATFSSGTASFSNLTLNKVGSGYTLDATSGSLTAATSNAVTVIAGTATQLLIATQPAATVTAGAYIGLTVTAEDAEGNEATSFSGNVTVALVSNPGGSSLGGTQTVAATGGVATFSNLTLNYAGAGYLLQATSPGLSPITSSVIEVLPGTAVVGSEFQVNTHTAFGQTYPVVAMDSAGDYVIAWESYASEDGNGLGIFAQRYNAAGAALGSQFQVNTYTTGNQRDVAIAMDSTGDFVIVWDSNGEDGSGYGIYGQRYSAAGVAQGGEFRINTYTAGNQWFPSVAMDSTGDFVVSWTSQGEDGSGYGMYAQRYNAAGVAQGGQFQVNTYTTGNQGGNGNGPRVGMDSAGEFVIAWPSVGEVGTGYGIYAQRYNAAGTAEGGEFRINSATSGALFSNVVAVGMDSAGDFTITWTGQAPNAIEAQRFSAAGVAVGSEFKVSTGTYTSATRSQVAVEPGGDFVVSWSNQGVDGSGFGISVQGYSENGLAQGSNLLVNTYTTGNQVSSSVAIDAAGDFVVVWESYGEDGSSYGIYAQRYKLTIPPTVTTTSSTLNYTEQTGPQVVDPGVTTDDTEASSITSATVAITSGFAAGQDVLGFTNQGGISGSFNSATGMLTLVGSASVAAYQAALESVTYTDTVHNSSTTPRVVSFTINDGFASSATATRTIDVAPGPATQLLITGQPPASVAAGSSFALTVTAKDAGGDVATSFTGSVSVAIATNPGGSVLGGTLNVSAVGGVATFSSLSLSKAGAGYTLTTTGGTLTAATSSPISVTPGAATQLLITTQPPATVASGTGLGFTVTAEDAQGNVATSFAGSLTVAIAGNPGGATLSGTTTVSATSGVAVFSGLLLNRDGGGYTLDASGGALPSVTTSAISILPATRTWTGASTNSNWTNGANWAGGVAPNPDDSLLFGPGAAQLTNTNDFPTGTQFGTILFTSAGYTLGGNAIDLSSGVDSSGATGNNSVNLNISLAALGLFKDGTGGATTTFGGAINTDGFSLFDEGISTSAGSDVYNGVISGSGEVIVGSLASAVLSAANTYSGGTAINGGVLSASTDADLGNTGGSLTLGGGTLQATASFTTARNITLNSGGGTFDEVSGATLTATGTISGVGALTQVDSGTLVLSGTNTYSGGTTIDGGTLSVASDFNLGNSSGGITLHGGTLQATSTFTTARNVILTSSSTLSVLGADFAITGVVSGNGNLVISGTGSGYVYLENSNTFTGNVTVDSALNTELWISSDASLGNAANSLTLNNTGAGLSPTNSMTTNRSIALTGGCIFNAPNSSLTFTYGGVISGSGHLQIGGFGDVTDTFIFTNTNTYSGGSNICSTLVVNSDANLGNAAGSIAINGGTLKTTATFATARAISLSSSGGTFDEASGTTLTINGAVSGNVPLTKTDSGSLLLTATNNYSGTTTINAGSLFVNGTLTASPVVVNSGGSLGGSGTISSSVTVASGGTLAPGSSPAILNSGNLSLAGNSTYSLALNGLTVGTGYDQTNVTGTVNLGSATLVVSLGFTPTPGETFNIINNDSNDPVVGTFSGLSEGSTFTVGTQSFVISYQGGDGNDVVLTDMTGIAQLAVTGPAASVTAGAAFGLTVTAEDSSGHPVSGFAGSVTVALASNPGVGTLGGTLTVSASGGVAVFSGLSLTAAASGYTLESGTEGLSPVNSAAFTVLPAALARFLLSATPGSVTAGTSTTTTFTAEDTYGNILTGYAGPAAVTSTDGHVQFSGPTFSQGVGTLGATLETAGVQTIVVRDQANTSVAATSSPTTVSPAAAAQLVIVGQPPATVTAGNAFPLTVDVEDTFGNLATSFNGSIAVVLLNNPGASTLGGTLTVGVTGGVASFSNLSLNKVGSGYSLDVSSGTLQSATSTAITVAPSTATQLLITTQPPTTVTAGTGFGVTVTAEDASGNVATNFTGNVTVSLASNPDSGTLGGTLTVSATSGVAVFSGMSLTGTASGYTLEANSPSLPSTTSAAFTVVPAALAKFVLGTSPASIIAGTHTATTFTAEDTYGNVVASYAGPVAITSTDNHLQDTGPTFSHGVGTLGATLETAGVQTIAVRDQANTSVTATSSPITVSPASAAQLVIAGQPPATVAAGNTFGLRVDVEDTFGNLTTGFSGSVTVALLNNPGASTLSGMLTASVTGGVASFSSLSLNKVGSGYSLDVSSGTLQSATSTAITVAQNAATQLLITTEPPSTVTAGAGFGITVTAEDAGGNVATNFTGSVTVGLANPGGSTLGGTLTLTAAGGVAVFAGLALNKAGGGYSLGVFSGSLTAASTGISVVPGAASMLLLSPLPATLTAGQTTSAMFTAEDRFGNTVTNFADSVTLSSTDPKARLGTATYSGGVGTFEVTLLTVGSGTQTLTVTDPSLATTSVTSGAIRVTPSGATHFGLGTIPAIMTAGSTATITFTALDQYGNTVTNYAGPVTIISTDPLAVVGAPSVAGGMGSVSVEFQTAGLQTAGVQDAAASSISGTSGVVSVSPAAASQLLVSASPAALSAGQTTSVAITAEDQFGNVVPGFREAVSLSDSLGGATLGSPAFTGGKATLTATLDRAGPQTIAAQDTSFSGTSGSISVRPAAATQLLAVGPTSTTAGVPLALSVTAEDAFNNVVSGDANTISFTSSDSHAAFSAGALLAGVGTLSATLATAGVQTITAFDSADGLAAQPLVVSAAPAAAAQLVVSGPTTEVAGGAITLAVTAYDALGNVATADNDALQWTSGDSQAVLPAGSQLNGGIGTFTATLITAGNQSIAAADATNTALHAAATVQVSAAATSHFSLTAPASTTAGSGLPLDVTALDKFDNVAAYDGTVHFTSTDPNATLPADYTFTSSDAGTHTFAPTLTTAGNQSLTVADTLNTTVSGTEVLSVAPAAATHLVLSAPSSAVSETVIPVTVTAEDHFGNVVTGDADFVLVTSSDAIGTLPAPVRLSGGVGAFKVTLDSVGSQTVGAADEVAPSVLGSATITITPSAAIAVAVTAPTAAVAETGVSPAPTSDSPTQTPTAPAQIVAGAIISAGAIAAQAPATQASSSSSSSSSPSPSGNSNGGGGSANAGQRPVFLDSSQSSGFGQNASPSVVFAPDNATGRASQTTTNVTAENVQQVITGARIASDQRMLLQAVSATGDARDNVTVSLPSDAIDRLPLVMKNLPDGHYRILFEQDQQHSRRLVFEIYMRQGRAVNSEDDLQGDVDRPSISQAEPSVAAQPVAQNGPVEPPAFDGPHMVDEAAAAGSQSLAWLNERVRQLAADRVAAQLNSDAANADLAEKDEAAPVQRESIGLGPLVLGAMLVVAGETLERWSRRRPDGFDSLPTGIPAKMRSLPNRADKRDDDQQTTRLNVQILDRD